MQPTLVLFSGLAGTGKTTLANVIARELKTPVISFDYFIDFALPRHVLTDPGNWTNQDVFELMNKLAEQQLSLGVSVILDAVYFSQMSRDAVGAMVERCNARFRVIHTFCSDKNVWKQRVVNRADNASPDETPAQWETIMAELDKFHPWSQTSALFIDSVNPFKENLQTAIKYLTQP